MNSLLYSGEYKRETEKWIKRIQLVFIAASLPMVVEFYTRIQYVALHIPTKFPFAKPLRTFAYLRKEFVHLRFQLESNGWDFFQTLFIKTFLS